MSMAATFHPSPSHPASFPPNAPTSISPADDSLAAIVKRPSPNPALSVDPTLSTFSPKPTKRARLPGPSSKPLTGAAAMTDERRRWEQQERESSRQISPNPAVSALNTLLAGNEMSRVRDAPPAVTAMSEPLQQIAKTIAIPDSVGADHAQTSPVSVSSFGSLEGVTAPTATASATETSPARHLQQGAMSGPKNSAGNAQPAPEQGFSTRSQTFPVPAPPDSDQRHPNRVLSMPMSGFNQTNSPRSPSTKRHKCPYCSTDFTRHHNLKSHLLTHSQEKPYECPTCQARFRRLHDLKRHTKLHTGERPHTCPKCGRKFARGDALARHNKGPGGCAGRRSSFGLDEDGLEGRGEDGMDGIVYEHGDEDRMDDDEPAPRRVSEPSAKGRQGSQASYHQHSSTYPPVARQVSNNGSRSLYPPGSVGTGSSRDQSGHPSPKTVGSSLSSMHYPGQPSVFAQGGMTESPKPISPGHLESQRHHGILEAPGMPGGRSPSMSHQAQVQQQYARGAGRGSSPMGLPQPVLNSHAPQLPSLPGLSGPDPRVPMTAKRGSSNNASKQPNSAPSQPPGPSMLQQQVSAPASASNSLSSASASHGNSSGGSMREYLGREADVWGYVRDLEARMARSEEDHKVAIRRLEQEVESLKGQLRGDGMGR